MKTRIVLSIVVAEVRIVEHNDWSSKLEKAKEEWLLLGRKDAKGLAISQALRLRGGDKTVKLSYKTIGIKDKGRHDVKDSTGKAITKAK